jgi:hypothetical protein
MAESTREILARSDLGRWFPEIADRIAATCTPERKTMSSFGELVDKIKKGL